MVVTFGSEGVGGGDIWVRRCGSHLGQKVWVVVTFGSEGVGGGGDIWVTRCGWW